MKFRAEKFAFFLHCTVTQQSSKFLFLKQNTTWKQAIRFCIEGNRLFPDVHLEQLKGVRDPDGTRLWMESVLWASEEFNRSATTANGGMLSPYEIFYGSHPPMPTLPFCKPAYHRIPRQDKLDRQVRPSYFLNLGYNHGSDWVKIMGLARRHMAPAAGTVDFPGPGSWVGSASATVRYRHAGVHTCSAGPCCHHCARCRACACVR